MKVLYIESRYKSDPVILSKLSQTEIAKLPKKIFLAYTIQYNQIALFVKKQLEKNNIKIGKFQQVLGCTKISTKLPILLISSGEFHAVNLFLQSPIIYTLENNKIHQIPLKEIKKLKAKRKTTLIKFLNAKRLGILVTTKYGQENLEKALKLKEKLKKQDKESHIFLANNIETSQFENFDIDSWINTACLGLSNDSLNIINMSELPK